MISHKSNSIPKRHIMLILLPNFRKKRKMSSILTSLRFHCWAFHFLRKQRFFAIVISNTISSVDKLCRFKHKIPRFNFSPFFVVGVNFMASRVFLGCFQDARSFQMPSRRLTFTPLAIPLA